MSLLSPETPLQEAVPHLRVAALRKLGLHTVGDLLEHYPRRYEDRRKFDAFPDVELENAVCLRGEVIKTSVRRFGGWRKVFEIVLGEGENSLFSRTLTCRWFNLHYLQKMLVTGQTLIIYGRPKARGRQLLIDHPEFEVLESDAEDSIHLNRITPVYPAGEGITPRMLRGWMHRLLNQTDLTAFPGCLPKWPHGITREAALRSLHFPDSLKMLETARKALVLEEFFGLQTLVCSRRTYRHAVPGVAKCASGALWERCLATLPFRPTHAQLRVIEEIREDLAAPRQMNRLLQGDVGSGKTLVALAAMLLAVEAGHSALLMAPTQVLADQHYSNFVRLLEPLGIAVALKTSGRQESSSLPLFDGGKNPQITVGTHALLYEEQASSPPGLIVIDEQHKFGVMQRARLIGKANVPDVLVMTATPIPRTLAHTVYGDLDVSVIDEVPAHRGRIVTAVREVSRLDDIIRFLRGEIEKGRQVYVVYPLIEESEKFEAKAAVEEVGRWRGLMAPHRVELLHGRMANEEKESTIRDFRAGKIAALISTTVIEVGVDVPNANVMLIENAERFGLAQLHQLRGRVGRGEHKSWCILLHSAKAGLDGLKKLKVLEQTTDGFRVAEEDFRMRGPGELVGTAQTGLPGFKIGNLLRDAALMDQARVLALNTLQTDPELLLPCHQGVSAYLRRHQEQLLAASA